jgi:hypothetical protein
MRCAKANLRAFNVLYLASIPACRRCMRRPVGRNFMAVTGSRNRFELRKKPRRHVGYDARIFTDKDSLPIACKLADVSEGGARLTLEHEGELPETFTLLLTESGKARRHCRVVWRQGVTLGVEFADHR